MTRPRGRPAQGSGVSGDAILAAALALLDECGGQGLTMRALAKRLGVTAMSLYRHVGTHEELLRALSDRVYADVLAPPDPPSDPLLAITALLIRYHMAIGKHPQLTLAIFSAPQAFAGVTREITDRLTALLATMTEHPVLWRDILVDHAHGSGLALVAARGDPLQVQAMAAQYQQAVGCLLQRLTVQAQ
ncbi:TetR/AcrR family transcriptional regulator [Hylemonella gracilis]|uniref:TetR/AcrR family transcriptional regulator n=1 Tax=Hylemonella gracilis TaxID=80880 RepID=A0A4P6UE35_9BURK|nr:TetR/AcrR family transcriptional regulator [Hylemonella gracilis]QBK03408.1 TetR/AcrR family transcriptional regulator [Hylemonella gracilis]